MRWGLIPFLTKELSDIRGMSTINARAESLVRDSKWREPFKKTAVSCPGLRVLRVETPGREDKTTLCVRCNGCFFVRICWPLGRLERPGGTLGLQSFGLVTTEANKLMFAIHTRMPVILHSRDYDRWLSREVTDEPPIDLLRPYESEEMDMVPANPLGRKCAEQRP
jgi:putative SOS response-associated peptidase YedK